MSLIPWVEDIYHPFRHVDQRVRRLPEPEDYVQTLLSNSALGDLKTLNSVLREVETTINCGKNKFQANIDVQQFKPDEISVKITGDNTVTIEGKHEEKQDEHGYVSRHFIRKYTLPKSCDMKNVQSKLSADGILTITAPKMEENKEITYRYIPIQRTGQVVKLIEQKEESKNVCFSMLGSHGKMTPIILVHGGAGDVPDERVPAKIAGVKEAARIAYMFLRDDATALDAVEVAVRYLEEGEAFNAGYGSVLNLDGEVEMDASIMVGSNLSAGAVTVVKDIAHPISLARRVMEKTPHILLAGAGANRFAKEQGIPSVVPGSLVTSYARKALEEFKAKGGDDRTEIGHNVLGITSAVPDSLLTSYTRKTIQELKRKGGEDRTEIGHENPGDVGTVGAVAIDSNGNLAAATSTGGINGKMVGRSSDTCMIGSGTYADDNIGAVSTTGHGETIAKYCLAHAIIKEIENGKSAQNATQGVLNKMTERLNNSAGAITISKDGGIGIYFTSLRMAWAYQKGDELHYGIEHGQDDKDIVKESD